MRGNVIQKFVGFCCRVEVEKLLNAGVWKFIRVKIPRTVKDNRIDSVPQVFADKVLPHGHHGGENVHGEESGLCTWC